MRIPGGNDASGAIPGPVSDIAIMTYPFVELVKRAAGAGGFFTELM